MGERGGRTQGIVVMSREAYDRTLALVDSLGKKIAVLVYGVATPIILEPDLQRALQKATRRRERREARRSAASQGR